MKKGEDYTGVTIVYLCHDGKGNILLNKRSDKCRDEHGTWDPGGGGLEFGDTIENTLKKEIAVMEPCTKEELDNLKVFIEKAISIIKENDEGLFSEFNEYVRALVLFDGSVVTGATSIRSFGNIYLRFPKKELSEIEKIMYFVEHIAHETSHLHLHALMVHDVMILNTLAEKYEAPIRPDPRPMFGIFHATFVLTRMIRVFESWISRESSEEVARRLDTFKGMHDKGRSVISEHGKLTTIGMLVFESLKY